MSKESDKPGRLHQLREHTLRMRVEEWRRMDEANGERPPAFLAADLGEELLAELDAVRAERDKHERARCDNNGNTWEDYRERLQRVETACQEAMRKADDHRRQRDEATRAYETTAKAYNTLNEALAQAREEGRREGAEQERALKDACRQLLAAVYAGDGKVVCPDAIIGPVRAIVAAMRER